jgi:uncharacterized protein
MKESFYNIFIDMEEKQETILYNSLYGSMLVLTMEEKRLVQKILSDPIVQRNDVYEILVKQKMVIEDHVDEFDTLLERKRLGVKDKNRLDLVLMPTLNCNLRCKYCYEKHIPSKMSEDTMLRIKKWIEKEIVNYKVILVQWFGGEPLIEADTVYELSSFIKEYAKKHAVLYSIHMTTNGYLFTKSIGRKLFDSGVGDYQITLDGPPEFHNQLRVLQNNKGTFKKIFNNMIMLAKVNSRIKITLRVNFNHTNITSIPDLLVMFPAEIRNQIRVVFEPIFGDCSIAAVSNISSSNISHLLSEYYDHADRLGYDVILGLSSIYTGKLVYCFAERENQYIVNYNGDCFKCSVADFDSQEKAGYIDINGNFIVNPDIYNMWVEVNGFDEQCNQCKYLPLCMGGCKRIKLYESKNKDCSLIATNAAYILKQVSFGNFDNLLKREVSNYEGY